MLDKLAVFVDILEETFVNDKVVAEIIELCKSFLTVRSRTISFIHQSAKDFLLKEAAQGIFPSGIKEIDYIIFSQSLYIVSQYRALQKQPGQSGHNAIGHGAIGHDAIGHGAIGHNAIGHGTIRHNTRCPSIQ